MDYILTLLTFALLAVLGLVSFTTGAGPAALQPAQTPVKPVADAVKGISGTFGIIAVIWGVWGVITFIVGIAGIRYAAFPMLMGLLTCLVLITVGVLAGYVSVAAFFGAPASGAGKFVDWFKRTFGGNEAIVGIVALVLAIYTLVKFILNLSGVYGI